MSVVLDASALIAMLHDARGAAKVAAALPNARISAVTHAEVVQHFHRAGMPAEAIDAMLVALPLTIVPLDTALAAIAGTLAIPGLDLGARCALALAHRDGLPIWTGDAGWKGMDTGSIKVVVVR